MNKAGQSSRALLKTDTIEGANWAQIVEKGKSHLGPRDQVRDDSFCDLFESFGVDTRIQ